jgi:PhnB protein
MTATPIPAEYRGATPYLVVEGAAAALAWYAEALGAREVLRLAAPGGAVAHAEIELAGGRVMLGEQAPGHDAHAPAHFGGSPVSLHLYVEDVDSAVARAVAAGATLRRPVQTMFYGDRTGTIRDPFGHDWHLATHVEDLPQEEIQRRFDAMAG